MNFCADWSIERFKWCSENWHSAASRNKTTFLTEGEVNWPDTWGWGRVAEWWRVLPTAAVWSWRRGRVCAGKQWASVKSLRLARPGSTRSLSGSPQSACKLSTRLCCARGLLSSSPPCLPLAWTTKTRHSMSVINLDWLYSLRLTPAHLWNCLANHRLRW